MFKGLQVLEVGELGPHLYPQLCAFPLGSWSTQDYEFSSWKPWLNLFFSVCSVSIPIISIILQAPDSNLLFWRHLLAHFRA